MFLFKELFELWRGDNSLQRAWNESHKMLKQTLEMFRASVTSLRQAEKGELDLNVYEADRVVNQYIRNVRRNVLKHLAVTGGLNTIPGLILTSIVIDIERIGDYTKNITDLAVAHPSRLHGREHEDDFQKIEKCVLDSFQRLIPILEQSDKAGGSKLIDENYWVLKKCDDIVGAVVQAEDKEQTIKDAATRALYARYLKRIGAHLFNIATSVVNPFEQIGFKSEAGSQ